MKQRLDVLLVDRGLAESRGKAQALIMAGDVHVAGEISYKAGLLVDDQVQVEVRRTDLEFVSRGAYKLSAAIDAFHIEVEGRAAMDVGASTGGFTDVLLRRSVAKVYAIDVGYGQLSWKLRQDPRVVVMERTNFRLLDSLPEAIDIAVVDVSFISLALILPGVARMLKPEGEAVILIKPQFEAGRARVGKNGVVRDPAVHSDVLNHVLRTAGELRALSNQPARLTLAWPERQSRVSRPPPAR